MAKVLVTGSRGTLGRLLVKELRRRGHQVRGVDLMHAAAPQDEYRRADVRSFRQMAEVLSDRYDFVYHLAAEFGRKNGEDYYEQLWLTNVVGTRNILELQARHGFGIILASTSEIYGDMGETLLDESLTDRRPVFPVNDYAISKWVNELQAINFARAHGSEIVRLRIFNCYGPGEEYHPYRSVVCLFCHHALSGRRFEVFRDYHRAFMFIDDLIPSMANVIDDFRPGAVYNLGGRDYRSIEELAAIVCRETGADPGLVILRDQDFPNARHKRPDIRRAMAELHHDPYVNLETGVPLTIAWLRQRLAEGAE